MSIYSKNTVKQIGYVMSREQLKAIFIEEAGEIIEKLDSDIIDFESNPTNKELMNELFRGVHTLKGNANAFGFTRLGGFVHHFEDLLDHFRSTDAALPDGAVDVLLNGVDIIKDTMGYEIDGIEGVPDGYDACLSSIIDMLDEKKSPKPKEATSLHDLAAEFGEMQENKASAGVALGCDKVLEAGVKNSLDAKVASNGKNIYLVELTFDKDIYFRGYDHNLFFKILSEMGEIKESYWNCESIPSLEKFSSEESLFSNVSIIFVSEKSQVEIEEVFEFLFDSEYKVSLIEKTGEQPQKQETQVAQETVVKVHEEPVKPNEIEHPIRRKEDKEALTTQKSYIKIDTTKLDELFDTVGELVIAQNFIAQNEKIKDLGDPSINKTIEILSKITKVIQDRVMSLRMVAIKDTFEKMKRVARDTAKKTDKEIKLIIQGEETEIDKTMIDSLSDPIVHMIRNAIDHGLENSPEDRERAGKDREGTISLRAFHKSGNIIIAISDDGRGINKEAVLQKAIERGLVAENEQLTDQQIYALIMQPGFSTAKVISDVSGRGVGLDVVKNSIEKLRGKVEVSSEYGKGSTFSIILPLTLAIIDGMLVKSGDDIFIIPTLSVVESFVPSREIVHMLKGKGEFVNLRGEQIPVIRLNEALGLGDERAAIWDSTLVCVESEKGRMAILVDALLGRQQVVIKTLGRSMAKIKEISGGAILGNGDIALILNIDGMCMDIAELSR
jgi:two-component system, chemotaxis family, sensor kinase CheA